jgi:lysophospholipase L1-like esterase
VSDDDTWPHQLQKLLGKNFEVINCGGPGGTSLETLVQSCLLFSELQPDVAVYYLGWNDARVQHVKDLWPDYSDSHGRWVTSFALSGRDLNEPLALGYLLKRVAFHYFFPGNDPDKIVGSWKGSSQALTRDIDGRAMALYERNLRIISSVCAAQKITPVFAPQIMNNQALTSDSPYGWLPFVRDKDLPETILAYNNAMESIAKENHVLFANEVLRESFNENDFLDQGHFTTQGNIKFAQALALCLKTRTAHQASPTNNN